MTARPYSDCQDLALALCGVPDANTQEVARVKAFINSRARRAYAASQYWPRWLKVEERICSEDGLVPYEEDGLDTIKTVMRIHATEPYADCGAAEYASFVAKSDGIQIAGYVASEHSGGVQAVTVTGAISPSDAIATYYLAADSLGSAKGRFTRIVGDDGITNAFWWDGDEWYLTNEGSYCWVSTDDVETPDLVTTWSPVGPGSGVPVVTAVARYSAWITYKAAMTVTYGEEDGNEDEIPEEWWEYCAHGAYSDFLRNDGQQDKAALAEVEAQGYLDDQLEQIDRQSGSHVFTRVVNHSNTQYR
jgi:hypothetical protein